MIIEHSSMEKEIRSRMRGGKGDCTVTLLAGHELQKHCRVFSEIEIPVGASIGPHDHVAETEYYLVLEGTGIVDDDGTPVAVKPGDVVVTTNGATHSVEATGKVPLKLIAVIVTDA